MSLLLALLGAGGGASQDQTLAATLDGVSVSAIQVLESASAPTAGAGSTRPLRAAPWHWVPFTPVKARRPRGKRQRVILFLGQ